MLDNRDASLQVLNNMDPNFNTTMRESYICMTTKEKQLIEGTLSIYNYDSVYNCSNFEDLSVLPPPYIDPIENGGMVKNNSNNPNGKNAFINYPITIYPNPSSGIFDLKFKGEEATNYYIEIFDILGSKVYTKSGMVLLVNHIQLDLNTLDVGTYYMKMTNGKESQIRQLLIMK